MALLLTTGGSHQPIRILWTGFILPGNLENCSEPSKHHPLCNCVNKIINDWMIKRAPMTVGLLGCRRTCAHRRVWLRVCVTEDFWKDSTPGGGGPTACVRSKTPTANSNACLVDGNQDTTGFCCFALSLCLKFKQKWHTFCLCKKSNFEKELNLALLYC